MIIAFRELSIISFVISILFVSGCVTTQNQQYYASQGISISGGLPSLVIQNNPEIVRDVVINSVIGQGYTLLEESDHMVLFSIPMRGFGGFMYQALAGSAYSTTPTYQMRIHIITTTQGAKVIMSAYTSIQQGIGRVDNRDVTSSNITKLQDWLLYFKSKVEKDDSYLVEGDNSYMLDLSSD